VEDAEKEFTQRLGFETLSAAGGEASIAVELGAEHMSRADRAHGGVLFALIDTAMGQAVLSALPAGRGCATLEVKINYFRPIQRGRIVATARLGNLTRNTAYADGEIRSGDGKKVLAKASGTFFVTATLKPSERERI
jgi:acyl-CoA thioesterase